MKYGGREVEMTEKALLIEYIRSQLSFSIFSGYNSKEEAKKARDEKYRELKSQGIRVRRWVLKNQLHKYSALGVVDGRISDVYMIDIL